MTTCPNHKHGCKIREHPDHDNYWYCTTCKKRFIEDPGFPFIIVIVGMIIAVVVVFNAISSKASGNHQNNNQQYSQPRQNTSDNGLGYDKSEMNQVSPTE